MKRLFVFSLLSCAFLSACANHRQTVVYAPYPRDNDAGTDMNAQPEPGAVPSAPEVAPAPKPTPAPATNPAPTRREARYGIPEPGKPGFMRSPNNPDAGLIDYRGYPPGTEVKDPYAPGKVLLVP